MFSEISRRLKSMKLSNFKWSVNDVSRKFQHWIILSQVFGDKEQSTAAAASSSEPPLKRVKLSKPNTQSHKALMPASRN